MTNPQVHYLRDLGSLIRELASKARDIAGADPHDDYAQGQVFAYYEIVTVLLNQAAAFGLSPADIGLDGFDPERELLMFKATR
jgi:hypothetical protein